MKEDCKILGVTLKLGAKKIILNMDEAKKLFEVLEKMFGNKVVHHYHDNWYWKYRDYHWEYPTNPIYCTSKNIDIVGNTTDTVSDNTLQCSYSVDSGMMNVKI